MIPFLCFLLHYNAYTPKNQDCARCTVDKTFAKNVFAHNRYNKRHELDRLVDEYKPDIMIEEMVERYFDRLLKYNELYGE